MIGSNQQRDDSSAPSGSSHGRNTDSLAAVYQLLDARGQAVQLELPPDRIPADVDRLLMWDPGNVKGSDWDALKQWVQRGHTLVLHTDSTGWEDRLPFGQTDLTDKQAVARSAVADTAAVSVTTVETGGGHFKAMRGAVLVHLHTEDGKPVLVSWAEGAGRIYWSADAEWLTNKRVGQADNIALALNLLSPTAGQRVAFDEYHHGYNAVQHWWQLMRGSLLFLLAVLCGAVALFFWGSGVRFGAPRPAPATPPRAAVEYVYSIGQLYRRAGARAAVRQALQVNFFREVARVFGGLRGHDRQEIAKRLAERTQRPLEEVMRLLHRLVDGQPAEPSEAELIALAAQVEELQRSVHNAGFKDQRDAGAHRS